jgi:TorA maturation chaperone TorD
LKDISFTQLTRARAGIYRLLAQLFYLPDEKQISRQFMMHLEDVFVAVGLRAKGLTERILSYDSDDFVTKIKVDFVKLFHGSGHLLSPPYECLCRGEKLVMGESTMAVVRFYREAGLELDQGYKNLPDHVSAELSFLAYLCEMEANRRELNCGEVEHCLELQRQFYLQHLGVWVEKFCANTIDQAQTAYYRELAIVLRDWCRLDQSLIKELIFKDGPPQQLKQAGTEYHRDWVGANETDCSNVLKSLKHCSFLADGKRTLLANASMVKPDQL